MIKSDEAYRNTCCMCCGIPQVSVRNFQKNDGTLVRSTVDHVLLRSLGGANTVDNLVLMCHDCNQMRGNLFAELDEFIFWYWSDTPLPKEKNFSYLRDSPRTRRHKFTFNGNNFVRVSRSLDEINEVTKPIRVQKNMDSSQKIPVLEPKSSQSVLIGTVEMNGYVYEQYKHPLFGTSMVKVEK